MIITKFRIILETGWTEFSSLNDASKWQLENAPEALIEEVSEEIIDEIISNEDDTTVYVLSDNSAQPVDLL